MTRVARAIPKLKPMSIKVADLCARELWRGYRYTSDRATTSDEILMNRLHWAFYKLQNKITKSYSLSKKDFEEFAKATDLRRLLTIGTLARTKGLDSMRLDVPSKYRRWQREKRRPIVSMAPPAAIEKLGEEFFKRYKKRKKGNHIAIASRLLFMATPDMTVFNYSNQIAKYLNLPINQPSTIIDQYHMALYEGLKRNWDELVKYDMPFGCTELPDDLWETARNNGWWQRRIYDLAILIECCGRKPKRFLTHIATTPIKLHA